jgi:tetratricopeptide (TPR) repeat protein
VNLMTINQSQGRWILAQAWLPEHILSQAYYELERQPTKDLCTLLVERNLLTLAQAEAVRLSVNQQFNSGRFRRPDLSAPSPSNSMSIAPPLGSPHYDHLVNPALSQASKSHLNSSAHHSSAHHSSAHHSSALKSSLSQRKSVDFVGRLFAQYEIIEEISRGGMGVVLKAKIANVGSLVALKLLLDEDGKDESFARFKQEAQVLAQLKHPSIVQVKNFGREEGIPFFAMELVEGLDLKSVVTEHLRCHGHVPVYDWTTRVMQQLAEALAYCHEEKVLHRDVKPANVIIEEETDRPVLVDFGLVKLKKSEGQEEAGMNLSVTGEVRGTPSYMAPEQADPLGDFGAVGKKTDVWGFGASLFFCLTGQAPYDGESATNIYVSLMREEPSRVQDLNPNAPDWLDELTHQCLQRKARDRLAMPRVARILTGGLNGPERALEMLGGGTRSRSAGPILLVGVSLLVVIGLMIAFWIYREQQGALNRAKDVALFQGQVQEAMDSARQQIARTRGQLLESIRATPPTPKDPLELERAAQVEKKRVQLINNAAQFESHWKKDQTAKISSLIVELRALRLLCLLRGDELPNIRNAERWLKDVADEHKELSSVMWASARVFCKEKKYGAAKAQYHSLILLNREQVIYYQELIQLLLSLNKREEAKEVLDRALLCISRAEENPKILGLLLDFSVGEESESTLEKIANLRAAPKALAIGAIKRSWQLRYFTVLARLVAHLPGAEWSDPVVTMARCKTLLEGRRPLTIIARLRGLSFPDDPETQLRVHEFRARAYMQTMKVSMIVSELESAVKIAERLTDKTTTLRLYRELALYKRLQKKGRDAASGILKKALKLAGSTPGAQHREILRQLHMDEFFSRIIFSPYTLRQLEIKIKVLIKKDPPNEPKLSKLKQKGSTLLKAANMLLKETGRFGSSSELTNYWSAYHNFLRQDFSTARRYPVSIGDKSMLAELIRAKALWKDTNWSSSQARSHQAAIGLFQKARQSRRERASAFWIARARWIIPIIRAAKSKTISSKDLSGLNYVLYTSPLDPLPYKYFSPLLDLLGKKKMGAQYLDTARYIDPADPESFAKLAGEVPLPTRLKVYSWAVFCDRLGTRAKAVKAALLIKYAAALKVSGKKLECQEILQEALELAPFDVTAIESARQLYRVSSPKYQSLSARLETIQNKGLLVLANASSALKQGLGQKARLLAERSLPFLSEFHQSEAHYIVSAASLMLKGPGVSSMSLRLKLAQSVIENHSLTELYLKFCMDKQLGDHQFHRRQFQSMVSLKPSDKEAVGAWQLSLAGYVLGFFNPSSVNDRRFLSRAEMELRDLLLDHPKAHGVRFILACLLVIDSCPRDAERLIDDVAFAGYKHPKLRSPLLYGLRARVTAEIGVEKYLPWLSKARKLGFKIDQWPLLFPPAARKLLEDR